MKKILAVTVLLSVIGGGVAFAVMRTPERLACMRIADLCGVQEGTKEDLDQCIADVQQWRKIGGDEAIDKGLQCIESAKTCGEAIGCTASAGFKGIQGVLNDFFKGFGNAAQ